MSAGVKYPHVSIPLSGESGNAHSIVGRVVAALRRADVSEAEIQTFKTEAFSGDFDHLLQTVMVTVETS